MAGAAGMGEPSCAFPDGWRRTADGGADRPRVRHSTRCCQGYCGWGHPVPASGRLGSAGDNVGDAGTGAQTKEDPMSDLQAIADRVEIEALRGESPTR
jgi:hypothetical protein